MEIVPRLRSDGHSPLELHFWRYLHRLEAQSVQVRIGSGQEPSFACGKHNGADERLLLGPGSCERPLCFEGVAVHSLTFLVLGFYLSYSCLQ